MKMKDCQPGDRVVIIASVISQNNGQTMLAVSGIGRSGEWSIVNSADCLVLAPVQENI